jgi:pimeloyl-ACP methyl ester carboxylesterase
MTMVDPHKPAVKPVRQRVWRVVRSVLIIYLLVTLVFSMFQEWFIFPGQATQGRPEARFTVPTDGELLQVTSARGDRVAMLLLKGSADSASRPTIIFFYGNAMCLADAVDFCREWRKLGANVVGVEYPGYGLSSGKPGEQSFYDAANAVWDHLSQRGDIDMTRIIPTGLSIGSGVAVELASRKPVAAVALFSPYTSLDDLARHAMPILPTGAILKHHFRNHDKIKSLQMPILIVHGRRDNIIPHRMSDQLARAAVKARVTKIDVDTDHNDLFELAGDELNAAMKSLIEQVASAPR